MKNCDHGNDQSEATITLRPGGCVKKKTAKKPAKKAGTSKAAAAYRKFLFVHEYIANGGNATQAAISAGYAANSAGRHADHLVKDGEVQRIILQATEKAAKTVEFTSEEAILSTARAIRFDPRKIVKSDGSMKAIHELDDDTAMALQSFEVDEITHDGAVIGHSRKIKWCDRNTAREQANKFSATTARTTSRRTHMRVIPTMRCALPLQH